MPATPACAVSPLSPAMSAASGASRGHRHKPILAERFKTKMCRTFVETGSCPYEERCMFAHGDADLRSKEMNLADKLTTEEAIRAFQRTLREKNLAAATSTDSFKTSPTQASPTSSVTTTTTTTTMKAKAQVAELDPLRLASPASDAPAKVPATAPPTPDASSAVKGLRFVSALCAPALGRHGETQQTPTAQTPCAADERVSSPSSAGCASGVHRHPAGPLDLSLSGDSEGFVAKEARSPAVRPVANNSKRYRHDPYAPVVFGMPLQNQYFTAGPVYCDPVAVAAPLMMPVTAPLVKVVVGVATPPQKALAPTVTVPTLSTYGPKTTYAAIAAQGRHEVLLA